MKQHVKKVNKYYIYIIAIVVLIGLASLLITNAAMISVALEAETGTPTNGAVKVTDNGASGSGANAIKFSAPTQPPSGVEPTALNTGPNVSNPQNIGAVEVFDGQSRTLTDVIVTGIIVRGGGSLDATRVRVNGSVVLIPEVGKVNRLHLTDSSATNGITINAINSAGNLEWSRPTPVDVEIKDSWILHPQGANQDHTEALAGFGWPQGAKFTNTTFVQQGPFNGTATGTTNWHGYDSIFDKCYFRWKDGVAAYYTVYVEGPNNVVKNSVLENGLASYIYPDSNPKATYTNNTLLP